MRVLRELYDSGLLAALPVIREEAVTVGGMVAEEGPRAVALGYRSIIVYSSLSLRFGVGAFIFAIGTSRIHMYVADNRMQARTGSHGWGCDSSAFRPA